MSPILADAPNVLWAIAMDSQRRFKKLRDSVAPLPAALGRQSSLSRSDAPLG